MSDELTQSLQQRLTALRQQNTENEIRNSNEGINDSYLSSESENDQLSVPVWRDSMESSKKQGYLDAQPSYRVSKQKSYRRAASRPVHGSTVTQSMARPTYEAGFRIVQQAIEAEKSGDPLFAMELYADAGEILVNVGKMESDPLLKKGLQEKAFELLRRAEQLDEWHKSVAVMNDDEAFSEIPEQTIQMTEVALVEKSWDGGRPPYRDSEEFTHMRYTAVATKDPINFTSDGYILRCQEHKREIRTLITVTMYNEDGSELKATLDGIAKNLLYMSEHQGVNVWKGVAVAIVSDGRLKASSTCLEFLAKLGAFDEEIMTVTSLGVETQMNLFESTVQFVKDENFDAYYPPMQIIYALKEHNGGKLNSHLWFFNAFAEQVNPLYTVLIDVGTIPGNNSIYRLIRSLDRNAQIGGVAGEIAVDKPNFFNPVIAAQHFEYKISNVMDKSLESVFGFISVLPGAFSAYRYEAIRANNGVGPLPEYFKSLTTSTKDLGPFKGNMYLAEDRILCFELLARKDKQWTMHYVKDAIASTDVPETLVDLIKQRRRWLNGSFFAGMFAIASFGRVWTNSSHSFGRKLILTVQFVYLTIQNILAWFLLSNLFLTFFFVLTIVLPNNNNSLVLKVILSVYLSLVGGLVIFALGNKPDRRAAVLYFVASIYFGLVMTGVTGISISSLLFDGDFGDTTDDSSLPQCETSPNEVRGGVVGALGFIFLSAVMHGEFGVFVSTLQYFFMLPTFVVSFLIFCFTQ